MEIREFIVGARQQREWGWPIILDFFVAGVAALFVAAYPGFLLGSMRPIPFWKGAYTPALFLVSALLSGLGIIYLFPSGWMALPRSLMFLQNFGIGIVVLLLFLLM